MKLSTKLILSLIVALNMLAADFADAGQRRSFNSGKKHNHASHSHKQSGYYPRHNNHHNKHHHNKHSYPGKQWNNQNHYQYQTGHKQGFQGKYPSINGHPGSTSVKRSPYGTPYYPNKRTPSKPAPFINRGPINVYPGK